jgi:site-specific recombinase XerD
MNNVIQTSQEFYINTLHSGVPTFDQIVMLDQYKLLDENVGKNRLDPKKCQIRANNDYEAIQCWLMQHKKTANTFRIYQKEAERFLLWCVIKHKKLLSSLDVHDLEHYIYFLVHPEPKSFWCASKGGYDKKRGEPGWRPFEKGLGLSAKTTAISILNSLFNYLVKSRYLDFNPFSILNVEKGYQNDIELRKIQTQERLLEKDEWSALLNTLEEMPDTNNGERREKLRLKLLVHLLYFLGVRISELEKSTWQNFREIDEKWWFLVKGKGGKVGKIPVNSSLLNTIRLFRVTHHFSPLPDINDTENQELPVICGLNKEKALSARYINKLLKALANKAADKFKGQPKKQEKLKKFSAHWLRHLSATMQDKAGIAFKHIKDNHRHANDDTTRIYIHTYDKERHDDMEKLKLRTDDVRAE